MGVKEGVPLGIRVKCGEALLAVEIDKDVAAALAEALDIGEAAGTRSVPDNQPAIGEAGHFPIFRHMPFAGSRSRVGSNPSDRPISDIVSRRWAAAEDRDIARGSHIEICLYRLIDAGSIAEQDRHLAVDDDIKAIDDRLRQGVPDGN